MQQIKLITETKWERWRKDTFYTKEPETIAWIKDFDDNCVFWDIGANIGVYSLFCAAIHPQSKIHAFEPLRTNYIRLLQNIWLNEFAHVAAWHFSVGEKRGYCLFEVKDPAVGSSGGQAKFNSEIFGNDLFQCAENSYIMGMVTGNSLLPLCGQPNYIKIDTDGNEYDILTGMGVVLSSDSLKSILVEINRDNDEICSWLLDSYRFVPDDNYNKQKNRESDHNVIFRRA